MLNGESFIMKYFIAVPASDNDGKQSPLGSCYTFQRIYGIDENDHSNSPFTTL